MLRDCTAHNNATTDTHARSAKRSERSDGAPDARTASEWREAAIPSANGAPSLRIFSTLASLRPLIVMSWRFVAYATDSASAQQTPPVVGRWSLVVATRQIKTRAQSSRTHIHTVRGARARHRVRTDCVVAGLVEFLHVGGGKTGTCAQRGGARRVRQWGAPRAAQAQTPSATSCAALPPPHEHTFEFGERQRASHFLLGLLVLLLLLHV